MKYLFYSLIALIICFGLGRLLSRALLKKRGASGQRAAAALITLAGGILILLAGVLIYFSVYYHAGEKARSSLRGNEQVSVREVEGGYFFDGPSEDRAIVFYPGAKVEYTAYAPLMLKLSEAGFDCFLAKMPFNFALLGGDKAELFMSAFSYDEWIMAGHSMGGLVAAGYASKHPERVGGIILLAAYTTAETDDSIRLLSVYGTEDGCLEKGVYNENKANWPEHAKEFVIVGGSHAQFADYGAQRGDGTPKISEEEQQELTVRAVVGFFGED